MIVKWCIFSKGDIKCVHFKCVSICFEFASTAEWQQLTHWVNTKAGIKFQNHSKQSLWFFVHKKELHIARNSISANKKVGKTVNYLDAVFYITKKTLEVGTTKLRKLHNVSMEIFFFIFYQRYVSMIISTDWWGNVK